MRFSSLFDTKQRFEEANVIGVSSSAARTWLAWIRSGIKGINYATSGLAWVSCEHVGRPWASTVPGTLQAGPGKST